MTEAASPPQARPARAEFIALMAMLTAMVAFSVDSMLPALPRIGADLSPEDPNRAQLILTSFVLGMGLGTFFVGALSDRFGRKPVVLAGGGIYILGAALASVAPSLELALAARLIQGIGAAAPRIVALAIVRDLYAGRQMARTLSIIMLVFALVPAFAPTVGAGIIALAGWRGTFGSFILFSAVVLTWFTLRQPETLAPEARRPLRLSALWAALVELLSHPTARRSIMVQALCFGMLFAMISSIQQIFDVTYGRGERFHLWFAGIGLIAASASLLNARLVVRLGMRTMVRGILSVQVAASLAMIGLVLAPLPPGVEFGAFVLWAITVFFQVGLTLGNLNALALEPMGHIAGMAASIVQALGTVGAVIFAVPVGLMFDGTPLPLACATALAAALGWAITRGIERDRG